jgi:GNAT superfamily N-acetyltransferase
MLRDLSGEERTVYFRGIQPIWGGGLGEERFQGFQRRLADAPEAEGRYRLLGWFEHGGLAAAMKAYDLRGACAGRSLRLLGIGAVFTPPPLRRRGHAAAMLRAAMDEYRRAGAHAAVLFSDIDVRYYERLGFHTLESRECTVDGGGLPRASGGFRQAAAGDEEPMTRLFAAGRQREGRFALVRDGWPLRFQLRRLRELARSRGVAEPEWGIVVEGKAGDAAAMIRFGRDSVDVLDAGWSSDAARECLLGALRECLHRAGRLRVRFWPAGQLRGLFPGSVRSAAIAMLAPLDEGAPLPGRGAPTELSLLDHI